MKKENLILSWDEYEIIEEELKSRIEEAKSEEEEIDEDELRNRLYQSDALNWAWEQFEEDLTEIINELSPDGYWSANVEGFGWRGLDGEKNFESDDGADFIGKILPKCDCTFYIYKTKDGLAINNFHHDSPTGREWYYLRSLTYEEYYDEE